MTTEQQHPGTPRRLTCPICGRQFTCELSSACWCTTKVLPETVRRYLAERYTSCVCSDCLDRLVREAGREA